MAEDSSNSSVTTKTTCIGVCSATALGDDVCRGCKRTFNEVVEWNTYTDEQKIKINKRINDERD